MGSGLITDDSRASMARRIGNLFPCLIGCVVGALTALLVMLTLDAPILSMLCAALFPAIACSIAGIIDKKQLGKIAFYAVIGWTLAYMLQPTVSQTAASHARRIVSLPLVGHEWQIAASIASTVMALVGVCFVPGNAEPTDNKHVDVTPDASDGNAISRSHGTGRRAQ